MVDETIMSKAPFLGQSLKTQKKRSKPMARILTNGTRVEKVPHVFVGVHP